MPRPAEAWRQTLAGLLRSYPTELRPELLVLPEGAIVELGPCDDSHPAVIELRAVAEEFDVVIVGGTMLEDRGEGCSGNTCPVVDASGLVGRYRKRTCSAFSAADRARHGGPGIFETRLGKIGVLICLDIEDDGLLMETAQESTIIANPAHIPFVPAGSWAIALDTVQRRLEWWASALGINIVRCDLPPPGGMGCSMVVTPCETLLPGHATDPLVRALLPMNPQRRLHAWMVTRWRSEHLDNAGTRIVVQAAREAHEAEEEPQEADGESQGLECQLDELGLRWESMAGEVLHRLLLPEPVRSLRRAREGALRAQGALGGAWLAWPVQQRVRTGFGRLWAAEAAAAGAGEAGAAAEGPAEASGGRGALRKSTCPEKGQAKGKGKAGPPLPRGPLRPSKGGKGTWTRRPSSPASSKLQEAELWAHFRSLAPCDICAVPWRETQQVIWAQGGSGGVLLVELPGARAVCVKPQGLGAVSELLAQRVAEALDVRVARCRVLRCALAGEPQEARAALKAAPTALPGTEVHVNVVVSGNGGIYKAREFLGVLEFVPGIGMQGPLAREALLGAGPALLQGLGRLCALDVLLNNYDRVPLPLWDNDGNLANILMSGDTVVGIDQQVNAIGEGPGLARFLERVRALRGEAARPAAGGALAPRLRLALRQDCGVELGPEALAGVLAGLSEGLAAIAEASASGKLDTCLDEAADEALTTFSNSFADMGLSRLGLMLGFVRRVAQEIREASA